MLGGGASSIMDMIIRHRNNMNLLRKKSLFKRDWKYLSTKNEYLKAAKGKIELKTATKEELALIRAKVLLQRKKENRNTLIILVIVIPVILYIGYSFINSFTKIKSVGYHEETVVKPTKNEYHFFIKDGDNWLKQNHWHNAIFQYKKALEILPDDFDANYKLAIAYIYRCEAEQINCNEAKSLINKLIRLNKGKTDLYNLRAKYYFIVGDTISAMTDYNKIDELQK